MRITRRDFLNGVALTIAAGVTPLQQIAYASDYVQAMAMGEDYYPPKLTGLRGSHDGSFEVAHKLGRAGAAYAMPEQIEEEYDLVIVGGGISGLTAAYLYVERFGADKKVLILENHDDFGGHAKRNEFQTDKGMLMTYGGSESLQSPHNVYSAEATEFIKKIGIDLKTLEDHFDVEYYPGRGFSKSVFFDQQNFGVNKIVAGDPGQGVADDVPKDRKNGRTYEEFIGDFPMNDQDKADLITLHNETVDYLSDMTLEEKEEYLNTHSYSDFLRDKVKLSDKGVLFFQQMTHDFMAVGIDAISCSDARACALPGFEAMGISPLDEESQAAIDDLYIHHFPDGNASIARLIVRKLIPPVAKGNTMEDIVMAKFDYSKLDSPRSNVRIRLNSTAINVENVENNTKTDVVYVKDGQTHKVRANATIMACYNMMIPYLVPSLPEKQKTALRHNVKAPLVYTKVALDNWECFQKAGTFFVYCPSAPYNTVRLDFPVSMGGYEHAKSEKDPIVLHMIYVPTMPNSNLSATKQAAMGRAHLLGMTFDDHEKIVRQQLSDMFSEYGFKQEDILGITVNRWSHGYAYYPNSLFDDEEYFEEVMEIAKLPFGNIYIANSDSEWGAYAHSAIDAAYRTVGELQENQG